MYTQFRMTNGEDLRLYLARSVAPGPAVVVLHAWWGLVADFTEVCDRLAEDGYFAVAPDLHGGLIARTTAEAERLVRERPSADRVQAVVETVRWIQDQPSANPGRTGLMGFSMGGATALRAAARGTSDAVVTFYGTADLEPTAGVSAPVLAHLAESDPYEPEEEAMALFRRLERQGTPVTVRKWSGTAHWFFEKSRSAYCPEAAAEAWAMTLRFLDRHLRNGNEVR